MAGSSIATPTAAGWITDFLNAVYYARRRSKRDVSDLRLAHTILATRWAQSGGRRLGARDLGAFHRAFGSARLRHLGRLDRTALLEGGARLLGDWFPEAALDPARRAHGVAFPTVSERREFDPALRRRRAALRELTPPLRPTAQRSWATYPPVELPDPDAALAFLRRPERWPDMGSAGGRFTALARGGLRGQTFEILVVAQPMARALVATRGYVTCTAFHRSGARLERRASELDSALREYGEQGAEALPAGASPIALIELTTHAAHFMGRAISHLLVFEAGGAAFVRDVGCWDPLPRHLKATYAAGGHAAQLAFWGPEPEEASMLAQLARVSVDLSRV
jgi:hypothetical protein